jgi:hypothetical protein
MKAERLTNRTKSLVNLLASGFLIVIVALCLISSSLFINTESLITLLVFDFLFLTLTFRLWGTLIGKLGLLALGNAVGLFCNLVFYSIHIVGVAFFGDGFNVFYAISYPILNLLWVVSFWSLSLAALPKPQCARQAEKP